MKTLFAFFCVIFFSGNIFASPKDCGPGGDSAKCPQEYRGASSPRYNDTSSQHTQSSDVYIRKNRHVTDYTPGDLSTNNGTTRNGGCLEDGTYANVGGSDMLYCRDFRSAGEKTSWRIGFRDNGNAEFIFKIIKGNPVLWTRFNRGTQQAVFTSAGAQQYAAANGGGGQIAGRGMPQVPQSARNSACDQLSGKARAGCEAASGLLPNIGGLLKW